MDVISHIYVSGLFVIVLFSEAQGTATATCTTLMQSDHDQFLVNGYGLLIECTSDRSSGNSLYIYEYNSTNEALIASCNSGLSDCEANPTIVGGRSTLTELSDGIALLIFPYNVLNDSRNYNCDDNHLSSRCYNTSQVVLDPPSSVVTVAGCEANTVKANASSMPDLGLNPTIVFTINGAETRCTETECNFDVPSSEEEPNIEVYAVLFNVTSASVPVSCIPTDNEPCGGHLWACIFFPICGGVVIICIIVVIVYKKKQEDERPPSVESNHHGNSRSTATTPSTVAISETQSPRPLPTGPQSGGRGMLPPIKPADGVEKNTKKKKKKKMVDDDIDD